MVIHGACRAHEGANLQLRDPGNAVNGGCEMGKTQVDLCGFDRGSRRLDSSARRRDLGLRGRHLSRRRLHLRFCGEVVLGRVIQILLGDGLLLRERGVTIDIELRPALIRFRHGYLSLRLQLLSARLLQLPLCLRQLSFRLIHDRLKRARIDLKEQLALLNEGTFFVRLLQKIARYLSLDIGVHQAVKSADPFAVNRDIPLLDFCNLHLRRRRGGRRVRLLGTTRCRCKQPGGQKQERWKRMPHSNHSRIQESVFVMRFGR